MFERTIYLIKQTLNDIKNIIRFFAISAQVVYLVYLAYAFFAKSGIQLVNGVLFLLSLAYFIFYLYISKKADTDDKEEKQQLRTFSKIGKRFYKRSKILVNLFPLGVSIYSICLTSNNLNFFTLLTTVFMLFSWILQVLGEIVIAIVEKRASLFEEAFNADLNSIKDTFTKPIRETGNFLKKIIGKEDPDPTPAIAPQSKAMQKVDKQVALQKEAKRQAKQQAQAEKKAQRKALAEQRKRERQSLKKENELFKAEKYNDDGKNDQ